MQQKHIHQRQGFMGRVAAVLTLLLILLSGAGDVLAAETLPPAPGVELHNTTNGVRISWGNVAHAYEYDVYRSTEGGAYEKVATLRKQNAWKYTDEKTKNMEGVRFSYQVHARAKKNVYGESISEEASIIRLAPIRSLKVKTGEGLSIDCSWEEHPDADGYEVTVLAEGLKRAITIQRTTINEIHLVVLYNTKTYRVQVRPYKKDGDTYYFANWCKSKKIRARYN